MPLETCCGGQPVGYEIATPRQNVLYVATVRSRAHGVGNINQKPRRQQRTLLNEWITVMGGAVEQTKIS